MSIFTSLLQKTSSIQRVCILFIASHLVILSMMVFTFPVINNQIGTKAFDLQPFGYSVSVAQSIVNNLNTQTTDLYLFPQLTLLDVLYPFLLALFLSSFIFRLFLITKTKNKANSILLIVPFLAMGFDYLENICVILMISKWIEVTETIAYLSSTATVSKGVLTSIAWIAILTLSVKWVVVKTRKKYNNEVPAPKILLDQGYK